MLVARQSSDLRYIQPFFSAPSRGLQDMPEQALQPRTPPPPPRASGVWCRLDPQASPRVEPIITHSYLVLAFLQWLSRASAICIDLSILSLCELLLFSIMQGKKTKTRAIKKSIDSILSILKGKRQREKAVISGAAAHPVSPLPLSRPIFSLVQQEGRLPIRTWSDHLCWQFSVLLTSRGSWSAIFPLRPTSRSFLVYFCQYRI